MTDEQIRVQIQLADDASKLLNNPVLINTINLMRAKTIKDISSRKGWLHRNLILEDQRKLQVIDTFEKVLIRTIQEGNLAKNKLNPSK